METVTTLRLVVHPNHLDTSEAQAALRTAAEILRSGGTVAFPTETVYGLGANALDASAVERIFAAKQRPAWDPIIVHVSDQAMVANLVTEIPETARTLMSAFWPGPLTLLLPRSTAVPDSVTAGRPLVGIRMPAHSVALELIRRAGIPIAAPSANLFGHTSPTTAAHVLADLDGRIDAILNAGPTLHGLESTVLDPTQSPMLIYRPGAITAEQIHSIAGDVEIFRPAAPLTDSRQESLPSPGVGLRHYAPKARLILVEAPLSILGQELAEAAAGFAGRVGVLLPQGVDAPKFPESVIVVSWGRWTAPEEMARELYAGLRELDSRGCKVILCPIPPAEGIGAAIRDRLQKATQK